MSGMQDESLRAVEGQLATSQADSEALQERITNSEAMVQGWSQCHVIMWCAQLWSEVMATPSLVVRRPMLSAGDGSAT